MSKAAFITGGVGKIGRAICISLANQGYKVFFTHRGSEAGKANASALLEELNGEGTRQFVSISPTIKLMN